MIIIERIEHIKNSFYLMSHINIEFFYEGYMSRENEVIKGLKTLDQIYVENRGCKNVCKLISENLIERYIIKNTDNGMYIIGPFLNDTLSKDDYVKIKREYDLDNSFEELKIYFNKHRRVPKNDNALYMNMIKGLDKLSEEEFGETISQTEQKSYKIEEEKISYSYELWKTHVNLKSIHYTNEFFKELFNAGELEDAYRVLEKYYFISKDFEDLYFQLNVNPEVLIKHLVISSVNIAFMYALQYKVDLNEALDILIRYNLLIEDTTDMEELKNLRGNFLVDLYFCVRKANINREHPLICKVKKYVRSNLDKKITLEEVSKATGYNKSYLSNQFKVLTGINIISYIQNVRVEKAKELLKNTNESVLNIADYLGFKSSDDFRRVFKKITNMTPREYRREN